MLLCSNAILGGEPLPEALLPSGRLMLEGLEELAFIKADAHPRRAELGQLLPTSICDGGEVARDKIIVFSKSLLSVSH
jgi:hypothetical protein